MIFWTTRLGKKVPLTEMDSDHLLNCWRRCQESIWQIQEKKVGVYLVVSRKPMFETIEECERWLQRFSDEIDRRKLKRPKISKADYYFDLRSRTKLRTEKIEANKKFDKPFIQNDKRNYRTKR